MVWKLGPTDLHGTYESRGQVAQPCAKCGAHTPVPTRRRPRPPFTPLRRTTPPRTPELSLTATPIDSRHPRPHLPACPRHSGPTIFTLGHRHPGPAAFPPPYPACPRGRRLPRPIPEFRIPLRCASAFCSPLFPLSLSVLAPSDPTRLRPRAAALAASEA